MDATAEVETKEVAFENAIRDLDSDLERLDRDHPGKNARRAIFPDGITPGRFAISPSASLSVRGERGFFVARDTLSFVGATGGRFGINNETTLGGGLFWERVNVSVGLSLAAYSLPICGLLRRPHLRLAPGRRQIRSQPCQRDSRRGIQGRLLSQ